MSTEDDFAAFRRVSGEELDKLREENAELRKKVAELEHFLSPKP